MFVYAGIDEAGYGPAFGPLTVGCCVMRVPRLAHDAPPPDLWKRLNKAVCRTLSGRKGRVVVNDSKKLKTKAAGIKHLETGCLAFASLAGITADDVASWLDAMGEASHRSLFEMPWYAVSEDAPWQALPATADAGELAIARGMLSQTCKRIGVEVAAMRTAVVLEDRFNQMTAATRSKAAVNFTFIAKHLHDIWQHHGRDRPTVVVDRQSGRMRYRDTLAMNFGDAVVSVLEETPTVSRYLIEATPGVATKTFNDEPSNADRCMTVTFQTEAEQQHMPVALASMLAKYARELMMERFNHYFQTHTPHIAPTAGYGSDAKRFWQEIQPELSRLKIDGRKLRRLA